MSSPKFSEARPLLDLAGILAPCPEHHFLASVLGRSFCHLPGPATRFSEVLSWAVLNHTLSYTAVCFPQLSLWRSNQQIPAAEYCSSDSVSGSRVSPSSLNSLMRLGATLVLDRFDELSQTVEAISVSIERRLGVPVRAKVFATCAASGPQNIWGDEDMIILQCIGRTEWEIHEYAIQNPLTTRSPEETFVTWAGPLTEGDALYVPQGWACTLTVGVLPAAHVALIFRNPTGYDFAQHVLTSLTMSVPLRAACPRFATPDAQSHYLTALQRSLLDAVARPGLILGLLARLHASIASRTYFGLPWSVIDTLPDDLQRQVIVPLARFPDAGLLTYVEEEDAVEVCHDRKLLRFHAAAGAVIESLLNGPELTMQEFFFRWESGFDRGELAKLLMDLAGHNVIGFKELGRDPINFGIGLSREKLV
jgi:hypothetical protein